MIDYSECTKEELIDVVDALARGVIRSEYPNWLSVPEIEVFHFLRCEGLPLRWIHKEGEDIC